MRPSTPRFPVVGRAVASRVVAGSAVLLHPDADSTTTLNEHGTFLWKLICVGGSNAEDLTRAVVDEYDVTGEVARADVDAFLDQLATAGFITFKEG